ncbi:MAG: adenylyltransferase/cytidyltransferase family protein, partial [Deltaproteobacteria bacterium]
MDIRSKIIDPPALADRLRGLRSVGKRVVFTNGCFDILHIGHVRYLSVAKNEGDLLVVGLNSDQSVRLIKGK